MWGLRHDYAVTGTLSPDATCNYYATQWYNGRAAFRRADGSYWIWWDGTDTWNISAVLGTQGADYWTRTDPDPAGTYTPGGTATGTATVAAGTHV